MSGSEERIVATGYDAVADRYAALEEGEGAWPRGRRLAAFMDLLPASGAVLDLGCGNGVPVARDLAKRGFHVTGVDISPEQVNRARESVAQGTFIVAGMLDVELPDEAFDGIVSFYAIDHVPRERHHEVFARIRCWLRPGGFALVAIEDDDQAGDVRDWLGAPMFFSVYPRVEEQQLAEHAGLEILSAEVEEQLEQGCAVPYTWLALRRPR